LSETDEGTAIKTIIIKTFLFTLLSSSATARHFSVNPLLTLGFRRDELKRFKQAPFQDIEIYLHGICYKYIPEDNYDPFTGKKQAKFFGTSRPHFKMTDFTGHTRRLTLRDKAGEVSPLAESPLTKQLLSN
jgi:hypothetical protein